MNLNLGGQGEVGGGGGGGFASGGTGITSGGNGANNGVPRMVIGGGGGGGGGGVGRMTPAQLGTDIEREKKRAFRRGAWFAGSAVLIGSQLHPFTHLLHWIVSI